MTKKNKGRPPKMICWKFERPNHFHMLPEAIDCPFEYVYREMGKRAARSSPSHIVLHLPGDWELMFKIHNDYDLADRPVMYKIQNKTLIKATKYKYMTKEKMYRVVRRWCSCLVNKKWR